MRRGKGVQLLPRLQLASMPHAVPYQVRVQGIRAVCCRMRAVVEPASCGIRQGVEKLQSWKRLARWHMWHGCEAFECALALVVMRAIVLGAAQGERLNVSCPWAWPNMVIVL